MSKKQSTTGMPEYTSPPTRTQSLKDTAPAISASAKSIIIQQPKIQSVALEVHGTAALIQNNFSQKAMEQMLKKHMGLSVQRETKKPREVLEAATIRNTSGAVCLPPTAFKKGMLTASTSIKTLKKTQLRTALFVEGSSIPIKYKEMIPRMDMVRTSGMSRTPDVRFRPEFRDWSARLVIQFSDALSIASVVDLLNRAGSVGVGEWRPEKDGTFGTYKVVRNIEDLEEVTEVREACAVPLVGLTIPEWALDSEIDPKLMSKIANGKSSSSDDEEGEEGLEDVGE